MEGVTSVNLNVISAWSSPRYSFGAIVLLLYINDVSTDIGSSIRLFANDCVVY